MDDLLNQLKQNMLGIYGDYFFNVYDRDPVSIYRFSGIAKSSVGRGILGGMYEDMVKTDEEFLPLEKLEIEKKNYYWEASREFFPDMDRRVQACRVMYVMDWITGTFKK